MHQEKNGKIKFIMSDDVFDYLLDTRAINSRVNRHKDDLANEYVKNKHTDKNNTKIWNITLIGFRKCLR